MRILVLGATAQTGILLVRELLTTFQSSTILLYVRSPNKLPTDISSNPSTIIITGQLDDRDNLSKALEGVDAVISLIGPTTMRHVPGTPIANAYTRIIELMHEQHVKRLIAVATPSFSDPNDKSSLVFSFLVNAISLAGSNAYKDIIAIGNTIRQKGSDLDWTIIRLPMLTNKESTAAIAGYVGDGKTGVFLPRAAAAKFMVGELLKPEWVQKAPLISAP